MIKELYKELYERCTEISDFCYSGNESDNPYAHFVAIKGEAFASNTKRFMLVGRAPNGWGSLDSSSAEAFSESANEQFSSQSRWDWVEEVNGVLYSGHDEDKTNVANRYCLDRSAFWAYAKDIWEQLTRNNSDNGPVWMKNIAWSNLYKVSPKKSGNPSKRMRSLQVEVCADILVSEIRLFNPTHILFMTGFDWFSPFETRFSRCIRRGKNYLRGKYKNDVYAEGTAWFDSIPVVVSCRPEFRDKQLFVNDIVQAFNGLLGEGD